MSRVSEVARYSRPAKMTASVSVRTMMMRFVSRLEKERNLLLIAPVVDSV